MSEAIRMCLGVSNVPVDFFTFLSAEFAACSKLTSRGNHRKASYPRTQQCDQGHRKNDACNLSATPV